jgi:iron-sulfur cluster assembly protein
MIKLTESAVQRIQDMLAKRDGSVGLRVGVVKSGCSGYSYAMDFATDISEQDSVIEQGGVKVIVNTDDMPMLDGMELDFVKQGLNQSFKFNNPNAVSECGCGESFSVTK